MAEDGSQVNRPVVRLEAYGAILTRIDPSRCCVPFHVMIALTVACCQHR